MRNAINALKTADFGREKERGVGTWPGLNAGMPAYADTPGMQKVTAAPSRNSINNLTTMPKIFFFFSVNTVNMVQT